MVGSSFFSSSKHSQNYCEICRIHTFICSTVQSRLWLFVCVRILSLRAPVLPQMVHWNILVGVWMVRVCLSSAPLSGNLALQVWQAKDLVALWRRSCAVQVLLLLKVFGHRLHWKGLSNVWVYRWECSDGSNCVKKRIRMKDLETCYIPQHHKLLSWS